MNEQEGLEKEGAPFFSMELENITYEIHLDSSDDSNLLPYGMIKVLREGTDEKVSFKVKIEEVVVNIVKFLGNKNTFSTNDISFFIERNEKEKLEMTFFGSFGDLKIDEVSNLEYNANQ